jgi:hypothetical protein
VAGGGIGGSGEPSEPGELGVTGAGGGGTTLELPGERSDEESITGPDAPEVEPPRPLPEIDEPLVRLPLNPFGWSEELPP